MTQMPDGFSIRQAEPADYANVAPMHYQSWRLSYRGIVATELLDLFDWQTWVDREYPLTVSRPGWAMWLAESRERIAGMIIFGPEPGNPDHLQIDALYVAVGDERRGIGGLLLDHALNSEPAHDAVLWCAEMNHRARRFYQKKGFQRDGRSVLLTLIPDLLAVPQIGFTLHRSTSRG
ncbi:N-acetyltransferase [Mycobacterium kansasii]|nr:N-acetyltransferase [Mycobacterium kansasii]